MAQDFRNGKKKKDHCKKMIKAGEVHRFIRNLYRLYDGELPEHINDHVTRITTAFDSQNPTT